MAQDQRQARRPGGRLAKVLTIAALQHGQKCITHHNVLLKQYEGVLTELTQETSEEGCADVGAAAAGIWAAPPHIAVTAVSRLPSSGWSSPRRREMARELHLRRGRRRDQRGRRLARRRVGHGGRLGHRVPRRRDSRGGSRGPRVARRRRAKGGSRRGSGGGGHRRRGPRRITGATRRRRPREGGGGSDRGRSPGFAPGTDASLPWSTGAAADAAGALCLALVKALAPKLADAAVDAAGPTPAEVGADTAPERRDARALAMCVTALRRFRSYVGAEYEGKVRRRWARRRRRWRRRSGRR